MKLRLEFVLLIAIFVGLGGFAAYSAEQSGQSSLGARTTSFSSSDEGALALYRWLERTYRRVDRLAYRPFGLAPTDGLLLVLGPSERYEPAEVADVVAWVEAGGVVVVADDVPSPRSQVSPLLEAFGLRLERIGQVVRSAKVVHPALGIVPVAELPIQTQVAVMATNQPPTFAPLAVAAGKPVVTGLRYGQGYVIALSSLYPFTNVGLRDPAAAALLLNIVSWLPSGKRIVFDEFHHGFGPATDLRTLLLSHPLGWAIVYSVVVIGLYIVAGSRRFARPLPLRSDVARRSTGEYIDSMAGMLRHAGQVAYAAEHYRQMLRRRLGRPYGLSPALDDEEFVAALAAARPLDREGLRRILAALRRVDLNETDLLALVAEADRLG